MRPRRSRTWIYRWSRPLIGAIAIAGACLTAYLTVVKLAGGQVVCSLAEVGKTAGCNSVLSSPYAQVFGLPLSLFGFLAYVSMAIFALSPLAVSKSNKRFKNQLESWTWLLLLAGATAMATFSGYLMYVLAFEIQAVCYYCIGSALFALSMLLLTLFGRDWEDIGQILFTGLVVVVITLVGTLGIYSGINSVANADGGNTITRAEGQPVAPYGWEITTTSGPAEIELAEHLTAIGAKKYGSFTCPHCYEQKQLFGKEAFNQIDYVECHPQGKNPQPQACSTAGIQAVPAWEINGELYTGTKTLQELAELSNYQGNQEFKYKL